MPGYQKFNNNKKSYFKEEIPKFDVSKLNNGSYVEIAESVVKKHQEDNDKNVISTSQIRNLLDLLNGLRERLRTERVRSLTEEMIGQVQYIKLRIVYSAGRDKESRGIRDFINRSGLINCLDTVGESPEQYELICKYMEALVAYHKYYISK